MLFRSYPRTCSGRGRSLDFCSYWGPHSRRSSAASANTTSSARFTFQSSLNRPRITAILSVVFIEDCLPEASSVQSAVPMETSAPASQFSHFNLGSGSTPLQPPSRTADFVPDEDMLSAEPGPQASLADLAPDMLVTGGCRIVEENPED